MFHPAVAAWFEARFASATAAQADAWSLIKAGRHTLIAAPTGSGTATTQIDGDPTATNGVSQVHLSGGLHGPDDAATQPATAPSARLVSLGRPVMETGSYTSEGVLEPTLDPETGLDSALTWANAIAIEEARSGRYGRPVSVVVAELDGLDRIFEETRDALRSALLGDE